MRVRLTCVGKRAPIYCVEMPLCFIGTFFTLPRKLSFYLYFLSFLYLEFF